MRWNSCNILILQAISVSLFGQGIVRESEMKDVGVRTVIEKYATELREKGFDDHSKYQIALRVNPMHNPKVAIIQGVRSLSFFVHEIPEYFFKYQGRLVFVFPLKVKDNSDSILFSKFYDQFERDLEQDINRDRSRNADSSQWLDEVPCWRIMLLKGQIQSTIYCVFPTYHISQSHKYDDSGNLIYRDGIPDGMGMGKHGARPPTKFGLGEYVLSHTDVPRDSLSGAVIRNVMAILVIDERGKVIEVKVKGIKHDLTRYKVENALMKMPRWTPASRGGKPIKVRVRWGV